MTLDLVAPRRRPALPREGQRGETLRVRTLSAGATRGVLQFGGIVVPCALGRGGISRFKREGDGATPAGRFELLQVYYRRDRGGRPRSALPVAPLPRAGWCDAPGHPRYNALVPLPCAASHEDLWRDDPLYDIVVVLDCNLHPAVPGLGSAIFFHLARPGYTSTEGCVAVARADMERLLSACGPGAAIEIG
ncbi:L,D-transpeptidase [Stappia sp. P2PMeth1]|uniref:L,D-transpeptidase family protein n=1 Tax=Stappia sp. P2PMeth1 TaxID=2003586 RepID=UPI001645B24D|nr:L,D-transpeptidase family protein [Stappia sp. P2PMeth1]